MLEQLRTLIGWIQDSFAPFFNTFFLGVLIALIGVIIGRIVGTVVQKFLHSTSLNALLEKSTGHSAPVEQIISHFVRYLIYFVFVVMALNTIGITTTLLTIIATAALIILAFSILLGIKDFIPNAIAGLRIQQQTHYKVGDQITVDSVQGTIKRINLTDTEITTPKGDLIYLPNTLLTTHKVVLKPKKVKKSPSKRKA